MLENRTVVENHPSTLVDYMLENNLQGRIFNDFEIGGYLIYRMHPNSQVYIDGRSGILSLDVPTGR